MSSARIGWKSKGEAGGPPRGGRRLISNARAPGEVPPERLRVHVDRSLRPERAFVLYWMIAYRRLDFNFALERAVGWARELGRPLVVLEALRCDYRWASDRHHRFILDGMADHRRRLQGTRVGYHPYVETEPEAVRGLLEAPGRHAWVVVTDDWPCFFLPRMVRAASAALDVRLELVDSSGLYPVRATDCVFNTARSFRRHLQRELPSRRKVDLEAWLERWGG